MARRLAGIALILVVAWLGWHALTAVAPAVTLPAGNVKSASAVPGYTGVGSCASASCHGGAMDSSYVWQRSYSVWSTQDKHASAYQILYGERAKRIVQLLDNLPSPGQARPFDDRRCLGCHTTVDPAAPRWRDMLADGIGCESCHGPAQSWLVDHTQWPDPLPAGDKDAKAVEAIRSKLFAGRNMKNTKDVFVAAGTCVGCHVGEPQHPGETVSRDMNHDMIAAGHPRLNFEFSAYLARMPQHWPQRTDEAQAWAVGQAVTAQAALRLLADRADAAAKELSEGKPLTWPEFSEFDCFRCHHDLRGGDSGQQALLAIPAEERPAPGGYLWGTWHLTMTRALAAQNKDADCIPKITELVRVMARPYAEPKSVQQNAAALATALEPLAAALRSQNYDLAWIRRTLVEAASPSRVLTWDQAAQAYLACVALNNERVWRTKDAPSPVDAEIKQQLEQLRAALQFGRSGPLQFDSPRDFDPLAVRAEFQSLQELFQKLGP